MAYSVREERQSLETSLREELDEAERVIIQVRRDNAESFLQLLDSIDERFTQLEASGLDLRPEQTRWNGLHGSPVHAGIDRQQGVPFPFCPFAITWISLSSKELAH